MSVRQYRLICLNPDNGHMELVRRFEAPNDTSAVELADRWRKKRAAELWRSYRVVMQWRAEKQNGLRFVCPPTSDPELSSSLLINFARPGCMTKGAAVCNPLVPRPLRWKA